MEKYRFCRQCGTRFIYTRDDQQFCSPKCVAQFYRDNPNPDYIHAANMDEFWHECEHCHTSYFVNGYAQRGGKRAPKYCSVKCKQAAYRVRKQEVQDQAARRNSGNVGNADAPPRQSDYRNRHAPPPPHKDDEKGAPSRKCAGVHSWRYVGTSRRTEAALDEALRILGLSHKVGKTELRKSYLAMISHWHPDRNPDPDAEDWAKAINWAYDYLK